MSDLIIYYKWGENMAELQAEAKLKEAQAKLKDTEAKLVESEAKLTECESHLKTEK